MQRQTIPCHIRNSIIYTQIAIQSRNRMEVMGIRLDNVNIFSVYNPSSNSLDITTLFRWHGTKMYFVEILTVCTECGEVHQLTVMVEYCLMKNNDYVVF